MIHYNLNVDLYEWDLLEYLIEKNKDTKVVCQENLLRIKEEEIKNIYGIVFDVKRFKHDQNVKI
jgi:hypothetical protein